MVHRMAGARRGDDDFASGGARALSVSTVVGVESAQGDVWRAQVTYVSDRLVGLRGWTIVDGRFRERDTVTLLIGEGDRLVSGKAQVLAASGSLMRIVRRDASEESERRLAPRLRVDLLATVTVSVSESGLSRFETDVVDLSSSGCAIRATTRVAGGHAHGDRPRRWPVRRCEFAGLVVRTWMAARHAARGVQFDPMPAPTTQLLNRFLVDQLRGESAEPTSIETRRSGRRESVDVPATRTSSARVRTPELLQHACAAGLDGAQADPGERGDLGVRVPEDEVPQDLALLRGEGVDRRQVARSPAPAAAVPRAASVLRRRWRAQRTAARRARPARRCAARRGTRAGRGLQHEPAYPAGRALGRDAVGGQRGVRGRRARRWRPAGSAARVRR